MSSVSFSNELLNMQVTTPACFASWSEARVVLKSLEFEVIVWREGHLLGTVPSGYEFCLIHCISLFNPGSYSLFLSFNFIPYVFPYSGLFLTFFLFLQIFTASRRMPNPVSVMKLLFSRLPNIHTYCFNQQEKF